MDAQVLHQHVQGLGPAGEGVHARQQGRHVGLLDGLEDLDHGREVDVLSVVKGRTRQLPR